jgi:hypothetical protein
MRRRLETNWADLAIRTNLIGVSGLGSAHGFLWHPFLPSHPHTFTPSPLHLHTPSLGDIPSGRARLLFSSPPNPRLFCT